MSSPPNASKPPPVSGLDEIFSTYCQPWLKSMMQDARRLVDFIKAADADDAVRDDLLASIEIAMATALGPTTDLPVVEEPIPEALKDRLEGLHGCILKAEDILQARPKGALSVMGRKAVRDRLLHCNEHVKEMNHAFEMRYVPGTEGESAAEDEAAEQAPKPYRVRDFGKVFGGPPMLHNLSSFIAAHVKDSDLEVGTPPPPELLAISDPSKILGRQSDVESIVDRLCGPSNPRLAVLGRAGVGKTALAMAVVRDPRVKDKFTNRIHWVSCETLKDSNALVDFLGHKLGIRPSATDQAIALFAQVSSRLRCPGPPRLIVLDDFSSLWDDLEQRGAVEDVLCDWASAQHCAILVTARSFRPPSIRVKWTKPLLQPLAGLPLDDARALYLSIHPGAASDEALKELLEEIGSIPTAVRLIAARGKHGELPGQLLVKWRSFAVPSEPSETMDTATKAVGFCLQSPVMSRVPAAIALLGVIAMLPSGARYDVLRELHSNAQEALTILQDHGLINQGASSEHFTAMAVVRSYTLRHHPLSAEETSRLFKIYYLLICSVGRGQLQCERVFHIMEVEADNMLHVLSRSLQEEPSEDTIISIYCYVPLHMLRRSTIPLVEKAIEVCRRDLKHVWWTAHLQSILSRPQEAQGHLDDAVSSAKAAMATIQATSYNPESEDRTEEDVQYFVLKCSETLSRLYPALDRFEDALSVVQEVSDTSLRLGSVYTGVESYHTRATILRDLGRYESSLEYDQAAIEVSVDFNTKNRRAQYFMSKATTYIQLGQLDNAIAAYEEALLISKQGTAESSLTSICLFSMARVHLEQKDPSAGIDRVLDGIAVLLEQGDTLAAMEQLRWLAEIYTSVDQLSEAVEVMEEALNIARGHDRTEDIASCTATLMDACLKLGRTEKAIEFGRNAVQVFAHSEDDAAVAMAYVTVATGQMKLKRLEDAENTMKAALQAFIRADCATLGQEEAKATQMLGTIQMDLKRFEQARATFHRAARLFGSCHDKASADTCAKLRRVAELRAVWTQALSQSGDNLLMRLELEHALNTPDPTRPSAMFILPGLGGDLFRLQNVDLGTQTAPMTTVPDLDQVINSNPEE